MTHEFKTPLATIKIALDAIRNPQIISDEERVKQIISYIKEKREYRYSNEIKRSYNN